MALFSSSLRGPLLILAGMLCVLFGQMGSGWPMVTGIALVGWGAISALHVNPRSSRQDALSMLNLTIYSSLVCLAIVAQSHTVLKHAAEYVSPQMLCDHAAAIVLTLGLASHVVKRLSQPLVEER